MTFGEAKAGQTVYRCQIFPGEAPTITEGRIYAVLTECVFADVADGRRLAWPLVELFPTREEAEAAGRVKAAGLAAVPVAAKELAAETTICLREGKIGAVPYSEFLRKKCPACGGRSVRCDFCLSSGHVLVKVDNPEEVDPSPAEPLYHGGQGFLTGLGAIRECTDCGCLVAGGPTRCKRCAREAQTA